MIGNNDVPFSIFQVISDECVIVSSIGTTTMDHDGFQLVNRLIRVFDLLSRYAIFIIVNEIAHVQFKRELESVIDLLPFPCCVVKFNPVQTER